MSEENKVLGPGCFPVSTLVDNPARKLMSNSTLNYGQSALLSQPCLMGELNVLFSAPTSNQA